MFGCPQAQQWLDSSVKVSDYYKLSTNKFRTKTSKMLQKGGCPIETKINYSDLTLKPRMSCQYCRTTKNPSSLLFEKPASLLCLCASVAAHDA